MRAIHLDDCDGSGPLKEYRVIQNFPEELDYVNAKLHLVAPKCGDFLRSFLESCLRADGFNYSVLQAILQTYMGQYPADPVRLAMERLDRGAATEEDLQVLNKQYE